MENIEFSIAADSAEDSGGNAHVTGLKIVVQGGTVDGDMLTGRTSDADSGLLSAGIVNYRGSELPSTGGMGTTMFYMAGGCIADAVCFILMKRKECHAE